MVVECNKSVVQYKMVEGQRENLGMLLNIVLLCIIFHQCNKGVFQVVDVEDKKPRIQKKIKREEIRSFESSIFVSYIL